MVYCSNCGEKNRDGSMFCSNCGEPLKSSPPTKSYSSPSKPLQSRFKSSQKPTRNGLTPNNQKYREQFAEKPYSERGSEKNFEWNVIIVGALILVIAAGILNGILPGIAVWIGAAIAIIYAISATKRKSTIFLVIPLLLVMAAVIWSFFSL